MVLQKKVPHGQVSVYAAPGGIGDIFPVRVSKDLGRRGTAKNVFIDLFQYLFAGGGGKGGYKGRASLLDNFVYLQVGGPETFPPFAYTNKKYLLFILFLI